MSTTVTTSALPDVLIEKEPPGTFTFQALKEKIKALRQKPALAELDDWLAGVQVTADDLRAYRFFKPGTYTRHRVCRSDFAELLVLCWRPGQRTPIHDHNGSYGAVRVCEGVMWETIFELDETRTLYYKSACEWHQGLVTAA